MYVQYFGIDSIWIIILGLPGPMGPNFAHNNSVQNILRVIYNLSLLNLSESYPPRLVIYLFLIGSNLIIDFSVSFNQSMINAQHLM